MKMEKRNSVCLIDSWIVLLLSNMSGKNMDSAFSSSGKQPGRGKEESSFTEKIRGFKGEKTCAAEGREGKTLVDLPECRDLSDKGGCGQIF